MEALGIVPGCVQVLENFKSYGGHKYIGTFSNNFSVIVGPNGSGKSNIIDAMLFVFGKKAKQIRQNKLAELIHNAGGERPDRARVRCGRMFLPH